MSNIYIGTSGWYYTHWVGKFYPKKIPPNLWLHYYSQKFNSVEVNSTFYSRVSLNTVKNWLNQVPDNFVFSVKGPRIITHLKKLKNVENETELFLNNIKLLSISRPLVVLWQLPPFLKKDKDLLFNFFKILPSSYYYAFEFRHPSWDSAFLKDLFAKEKNKAVVLQDWKDWPIYKNPIGSFAYIRLHGSTKLYSSKYTLNQLKSLAKKIKDWSATRDVYCYFNNDYNAYAPLNATKLKVLLNN